jgi:hypothetical protein
MSDFHGRNCTERDCFERARLARLARASNSEWHLLVTRCMAQPLPRQHLTISREKRRSETVERQFVNAILFQCVSVGAPSSSMKQFLAVIRGHCHSPAVLDSTNVWCRRSYCLLNLDLLPEPQGRLQCSTLVSIDRCFRWRGAKTGR